MTTQKWVPSGKNWMWATWVGDTQVIYVCFLNTTWAPQGDWQVMRKVMGSADPSGRFVGASHHLDRAQEIAQIDAQELQEKGL